jgi:hypothetical protein
MRGQQGHQVCQLPSEVACQGLQDCPGDQICGADAECRDSCEGGCVADQSCSAGACADVAELDDQGDLPRPAQSNGDAPPCELDSDCSGDLVCRSGGCRLQCDAALPCVAGSSCHDGVCETDLVERPCLRNSDCLDSQRCDAGECLPEPEPPEPACHYDSDCDVVGQHCIEGECACECKTDPDCAAGSTCIGECVCVRRAVHNTVNISNAGQVRELAEVEAIDGKLVIAPGAPLSISLPKLKTVGGLSIAGKDTVFSADHLSKVIGDLECEGECRLPELTSAGDVTLKPGREVELEFPALVSIGKLTVSGSQARSVSLQALTEMTDLAVEDNTRLTSVSLPLVDTNVDPALAKGRSITISTNAELDHLEVGGQKLTTVDIELNPKLQSVSFPVMTEGTSFKLTDASRLTNLDLPLLQSLASLDYRASSGPTTWKLPKLESVSARFSLVGLEGLRYIWAPFFTYTGYLQIANNESLLVVDLPLGKPPEPLDPLGPPGIGTIDITNNDKLERVSFSELQIVDSWFILAANKNLAQLDLPVLSKGGFFSVSLSLLTNLNTLERTPPRTAVSMTAFAAEDNSKLATCPLQALLQTMTIGGTPVLSNNLCPCTCP